MTEFSTMEACIRGKRASRPLKFSVISETGSRGGDGSDDHFAAQHRKHAAQALHDQKQRQQRADPGVQGSQDTHQRSSLRSGLSIHDQPVVTSLLRRAG